MAPLKPRLSGDAIGWTQVSGQRICGLLDELRVGRMRPRGTVKLVGVKASSPSRSAQPQGVSRARQRAHPGSRLPYADRGPGDAGLRISARGLAGAGVLSARVGRGRRAGGPLHLHRHPALQAHCGARAGDHHHRRQARRRRSRATSLTCCARRWAGTSRRGCRGCRRLPPARWAFSPTTRCGRSSACPTLAGGRTGRSRRLPAVLRRGAGLRPCAQGDLAGGDGGCDARQAGDAYEKAVERLAKLEKRLARPLPKLPARRRARAS